MKIGSLKRGLLFALLSYCCLTTALVAVVTVHVDMDSDADGIQASRQLLAGQTLTIALVAELDAGGVSAYGFSVMYDNLELSLVSADDIAPAPLTNLVSGTVNIDLGGGNNRVSSFDGFTFSTGPADTSVVVGTLEFTVVTPSDDSLPDVTVGFFETSDGAFDNTLPVGGDLKPTVVFNSGSVVPVVIPESSTSSLALLAGVLLFSRRRSRA